MNEFKQYYSIGDKIQIISLHRIKKTEYISQIAEIHDDSIDIFIPIYQNSLVYFRNDEILRIIMPKNEAIYEFDAKVISRSYGEIPIMKIVKISELFRIQRRDYYRLKITKPIRFKKVYKNEATNRISQYHEGILIDISGGGLMFCSKKEMEKGDLLELEILISENKKLNLFGLVIRRQYDIQKSFLYEYGIKFENISIADKNTLMKFIFEEQRKLLKKGLI